MEPNNAPETTPEPAKAPEAKTTAPATPDAISKRLSQAPEQSAATGDGPQASEPSSAIDLSRLSVQQLQQLKGMLNATPESTGQANKKPVVMLRRYQGFNAEGIEIGGIIIDHGDAYNTLVKDTRSNMTNEVLMMRIKFLGSDEWTVIPWKEFIEADQIKCEVISSRREADSFSEGEVISKETGQLVERLVHTVQDFLTVKLPAGSNPATVELEARIVNA